MARVPAEQRRQDFIEAAVRVIAEQGMDRATTRKIAEAAEAPLATLHYCFHTKEQLFFAVFEHMSADILKGQAEAIKGHGDLAVTAARIVRATMEWSTRHPNYARVQFDLLLWGLRRDGKDVEWANRVYAHFIEGYLRILRASVGVNDDPSMVEPLARVVLSIIDGLTLQWVSDPNDARLQGDVELACAMISTYVSASRGAAQSVAAQVRSAVS
ncbi:TetR/AcrR family transcriptional regulator [Nocardia sp. NBC_00565]|uniref:TetR/AcrR family transcriptional regulator n=1 Tax=Nocardia sp. NBC_00565 TaxID=2975993 RepID=UPI002E805B62|nr:TetR/AcrR family transcriptional regulator [Nocardia sp. NBC_00565]WUC06356.1 TetR/AcrR family transcriptional regulator [Nocardia sp. NBC_00565]